MKKEYIFRYGFWLICLIGLGITFWFYIPDESIPWTKDYLRDIAMSVGFAFVLVISMIDESSTTILFLGLLANLILPFWFIWLGLIYLSLKTIKIIITKVT